MFRKTLLACVLTPIGLIPFLRPQAAWACSCMQSTPEEQMERADIVFTGRVIDQKMKAAEIQPFGGRTWVQWTFEVESDQKGAVSEQVTVESASNSAACGINFQMGERYQVFANQSNTDLKASLCSGTRALRDGQQEQSQAPSPCVGRHGKRTPEATN
ncbi:hypothetical protein [Acaryochloris sp. CCMEE 5410]|uniref:hypothetical protein n=1 Tax=Acaryochloris sp. CCMEE 5410 TaxID=310037 RepID=UPI0002484130|nr:hypothetical protein [Acaryochloris sp. CCMEE 5410]KAI9133446.1 hypothetical protein ON05_009095 [Acaryochloris sp. CCMEE 5410]